MADTKDTHGRGAIEWMDYGNGRGCWYARVSVPGEGRRRTKLRTEDGRYLTDREGDRALARELTTELAEYQRSEASERERNRLAARTTVRQFGNLWTTGELYRRYGEVRGLKPKRSADDDAWRLAAHVYPHIGNLAVCDVTEQDVERCVARAAAKAEQRRGKPWRAGTRTQLYQLLRRLFDLAIKPGRLRQDNPVSANLRPRKDTPKLFAFLYPTELAALLGCPEVPLQRRVYYALAVYTGLRKGSLATMTWGDIDFAHGTITCRESKTDLPQIFAQSDPTIPGLASLMVVLKRWHEHCGCPGAGAPLVTDLGCRPGREAQALRDDLRAAGVTRAQLFERSAQVEPLRFHDLRATFVTWARRAGKGTGWISDRTGHLTEEIMRRYDRGARMLADLQYVPFPDLSDAVEKLSGNLSGIARLSDFRRA